MRVGKAPAAPTSRPVAWFAHELPAKAGPRRGPEPRRVVFRTSRGEGVLVLVLERGMTSGLPTRGRKTCGPATTCISCGRRRPHVPPVSAWRRGVSGGQGGGARDGRPRQRRHNERRGLRGASRPAASRREGWTQGPELERSSTCRDRGAPEAAEGRRSVGRMRCCDPWRRRASGRGLTYVTRNIGCIVCGPWPGRTRGNRSRHRGQL